MYKVRFHVVQPLVLVDIGDLVDRFDLGIGIESLHVVDRSVLVGLAVGEMVIDS